MRKGWRRDDSRAGREREVEGHTAGTAVVIHNTWAKRIVDIEPLGDRATYFIIKSTMEITTITTHIPQSARTTEEKEQAYEKIERIIRKREGKGLFIVAGDFHARLQKAKSNGERMHIGPHAFDKKT